MDKMNRFGGIVLSVLTLAFGPALSAGELQSFNQQVADAYAPYRSAMFYLRTGNPGVAFLDLDAASKQWQAVVDHFQAVPPDAFVDDSEFAATLKAVQDAFETAKSALNTDDLEAATKALSPIRTNLSDLRQRNGLRIHSDCIDEMNAAMDRLWVYRHEPPALDQADQVNAVKREAAITEFLYRQCYETAPLAYHERQSFRRLFEGSLVSLPLIFDALDQGNEGQLINILRELRSFDRMIWLEFG